MPQHFWHGTGSLKLHGKEKVRGSCNGSSSEARLRPVRDAAGTQVRTNGYLFSSNLAVSGCGRQVTDWAACGRPVHGEHGQAPGRARLACDQVADAAPAGPVAPPGSEYLPTREVPTGRFRSVDKLQITCQRRSQIPRRLRRRHQNGLETTAATRGSAKTPVPFRNGFSVSQCPAARLALSTEVEY